MSSFLVTWFAPAHYHPKPHHWWMSGEYMNGILWNGWSRRGLRKEKTRVTEILGVVRYERIGTCIFGEINSLKTGKYLYSIKLVSFGVLWLCIFGDHESFDGVILEPFSKHLQANKEKLIKKASQILLLNILHIFQCISKIFCVDFLNNPLEVYTKYLIVTW